MRNSLPKKPEKYESGILNLNLSSQSGSHWTAYKKFDDIAIFYDSYGNLKPPPEFIKYMKGCRIYYNYKRFQSFKSQNCGQLSLNFLFPNNKENENVENVYTAR